MVDIKEVKWWGWGEPGKRMNLSGHPHFREFLKRKLQIDRAPDLLPPDMKEIRVPESHLTDEDLSRLKEVLPEEQILLSAESRIGSTYGKSFRDLMRIRYRFFKNIPDAVLFPESETEILQILRWAQSRQIAVIPRGGGTSVVGGVEPLSGEGQTKRVVLDLRALNRVLSISTIDMIAEAEAGIYGTELESCLNKQGVTLSHYPESFQFSTLGGWIAARSAGQQSTLYGKIEDMVENLYIATPGGIVETPAFPAAANGPDWNQVFIGSEGILGIIVRARIKLKYLPETRYYTAYLMKDFYAAISAIREVIQSGIRPATVRLSDATETEFIFALQKTTPHRIMGFLEKQFLHWVDFRGFTAGKRCLLILGLEGSHQEVKSHLKRIRRIFKKQPFLPLGKRVGNQWYRNRFENPYLRDELLNYELIVDTLETATEWANVIPLYEAIRATFENSFAKLAIPGIAMAHLSHLYTTGSSLYFIFLANPHSGRALEEWEIIKRDVSETIVSHGGTISHHHGIGVDHRPWIKRVLGEEKIALLRKMKQQIDPMGILNPGKLLPPEN